MELAGLVVTVALALVGYLATYLNTLRLQRRADKLRFVTAQIDELYGPLYVITQTGQMLFATLQVKRHREGRAKEETGAAAPSRTRTDWHIWVEEVFMPLNQQLEQVLINKAHLIIEEEMPQCLKLFLAHSAGYKAVIKKWQMGDFSEGTSVIDYPAEIVEYAEQSYLRLKKEQQKLL
jgi:hypothetical protein